MQKIALFIKRELKEMLVPFLFFFVVFHIVVFARSLMAEEFTIKMSSSLQATIGALVVAKAVLIANALPLFNWFLHNRRIYNILWKIVLYTLVIVLFQILEAMIPLVSQYGTLDVAFEHMHAAIEWHRFWATHIILVILMAFYAFITDIADAIGRDRFVDLLFGRNGR